MFSRWLTAYRERSKAILDAALIVADAINPPEAEVEPPEPTDEQKTAMALDSWLEETELDVADCEEVFWARDVLAGKEEGERAEANAILVKYRVPPQLR